MNLNQNFEFDAMWSSSLTESLIRGKPDNQSVELSTRIKALSDVLDVTTKPLIFDADTGGKIEHFERIKSNLFRNERHRRISKRSSTKIED